MGLIRCVLVFLAGVPIFGSKEIIFGLLVLSCIPLINTEILTKLFKFIVLVFPIIFLLFFIHQDHFYTPISIIASYMIAISMKRVKLYDLKIVLRLLMAFHLVSFISLYLNGSDLIPELLFSESRHAVGINSLIKYRPSAIYQEPSNLALAYISIAILSIKLCGYGQNKILRPALACSLLTFSVISLISIIILVLSIKKDRKSVIKSFFSAVSFFLFIFFFVKLFALPKIQLYINSGISEYSRFNLLYKSGFSDNLIVNNIVSEGVSLDNGVIIYILILAGFLGIPLISYIVYKSYKDIKLILILFTKLSLTYPLFWLLIEHPYDTENSSSH